MGWDGAEELMGAVYWVLECDGEKGWVVRRVVDGENWWKW